MIDLGEIERINSCGVRDWVNWLVEAREQRHALVLVECSPAIVAQINLVNNFTGNGVVKSFYVPYFCPECDEEKVLLVEASDMGPPPHEPPTCRCDECDLVMDFDDMPDSYFAFLSNQRKLAEPDKINGAMRDLGRGSASSAARQGQGPVAREPAEPLGGLASRACRRCRRSSARARSPQHDRGLQRGPQLGGAAAAADKRPAARSSVEAADRPGKPPPAGQMHPAAGTGSLPGYSLGFACAEHAGSVRHRRARTRSCSC